MIQISPDAPLWAQELVLEIQRTLDNQPHNNERPVRVPEYADNDALPSAETYRSCVLFKLDINMLCYSDGSDWRRADTGATV